MDINDLLKDATLVANAAVRLGKPSGPDLCKKIADANKADKPLTWDNPAILPLQESFATTLAAISPVTLTDLNAGFLPYGPRSVLTKSGIAALVFLAFALLYVSAALSFWQTSAAVLIANSTDEKFETRERLLSEALPVLIKLGSLEPTADDKTDPNSVLRSTLRNQMKDIRLLSQKIVSDAQALEQTSRNFTLGCLLVPFSDVICRKSAPQLSVGTAGAAVPVVAPTALLAAAADPVAPGQDAGDAVASQATTTLAGPADDTQIPDDPVANLGGPASPAGTAAYLAVCSPQGATVAGDGSGDAERFQQVVSDENALLLQARCALGIVAFETSGGGSSVGGASDLARKMTLFSAWLLPALYGALGSVVFHLRLLLDPTLPNPDGWRIFLRICLSAFAGISLAWFWRPDAGGNFSIASVSVGSATMAFLIGYSIDAFFKLLDRLVFVANTQIDKLGGAGKPA